MNSKLKHTLMYAASTFLVYFFLFCFWEAAVGVFHISPITLVRPTDIIPLLIKEHAVFLKALSFTFFEIGWGWGIGNLLGVGCAICIYQFKAVSRLMVSASVLINAVPLVAMSAIIAGFLGTTPVSKIAVTALICFFPMFISALTGFTRLDPNHEDLLRSYASSRLQKFVHLVVPAGMPFIMTAMKLNVLNAIFAAITSEFFGSYGGIGQLILANRGMYNLPMVWGAIFYVIGSGAFFYFVVSLLQKKIVYWKQ